MEKRLQEIFDDLKKLEARKTEIETELRSNNPDTDLEKLDKEVDGINLKIKPLQEEQRSIETKLEIAKKINGGSPEYRQLPKPTGKKEDRQMENIFATMEYRKAFMDFALRGIQIPTELRADANTLTTDVGAVIPDTVLNKIVEKLEATGMILPLVNRTSIKGGVTVPTSSLNPTATWVAEGAGSDKQKKTTGSITFAYYKLRCAVSITLEVDTMALSAFETALIKGVVKAMVKAIEQSIVDGDGIGKPKGILAETPESGQAFDISAGTGLDISDVENAEAALPIEYEDEAVWTMTKKTFMKYKTIKDTTGQPVASVTRGTDGKLMREFYGRKAILCNYLPSWDAATTGNVYAFIFNFDDYTLNTNYNMGIKRYEDNETEDQVTKAVMLVDGKVIDKNSLVTLKKAV